MYMKKETEYICHHQDSLIQFMLLWSFQLCRELATNGIHIIKCTFVNIFTLYKGKYSLFNPL